MKKFWVFVGKLAGSVFLFLFCWTMISEGFLTLNSFNYQYVGEQEFSTIDEAQTFQNEIISTAEKDGAKIQEATITAMSPPTVGWRVLMPDLTKPFEYGVSKREMIGSAYWALVVTNYVFIPMSFFAIWVIWDKRLRPRGWSADFQK